MSQNIVHTNNHGLPRAIAKEKNGIVLYWVEELQIAGLHIRGLATLLECHPQAAAHAIKACQGVSFLEAETVTTGGVQGVKLISETDLAKVLRHIARSKAKPETRDRADDVRDQLAAAGFKLMVMLELAPRQLQAQINNHVSELDKAIEIERLRLESKQLDNAMLVIHGAATVLALRGQGDQVVEIDRPTIEVIDDRSKAKFEGQTTKQLADYCNAKFGTKFKSGAEVVRMLKSAGFQDLIATTPRAVLQDYIPMENIDTALRVLTEGNRQKLIGER